jgi:hypothetical protein
VPALVGIGSPVGHWLHGLVAAWNYGSPSPGAPRRSRSAFAGRAGEVALGPGARSLNTVLLSREPRYCCWSRERAAGSRGTGCSRPLPSEAARRNTPRVRRGLFLFGVFGSPCLFGSVFLKLLQGFCVALLDIGGRYSQKAAAEVRTPLPYFLRNGL